MRLVSHTLVLIYGEHLMEWELHSWRRWAELVAHVMESARWIAKVEASWALQVALGFGA